MPYITGVSIQGFQSHTGSFLQLGPGLNVITGPSDSGKTAVIRAVRWVAFGEPSGDAFVNEKTGEALVAIQMDNGVTITKRRKSKKTTYLLQADPGDEGQLFEKAEVPEEVKVALGINKQTFGDFVTALNFAFQLEAPFLISETASAGAKILGKLAGTEEVDGAIKDVSKDTYQARQERSQAEKDIAEVNGQLLEFAGLEQEKQLLETIEYLLGEVEADVNNLENLKQQQADLDTIKESLHRAAERLAQLAHVPELEADLKDVEKAQQRYDTLLDLFETLGKATATVETLTQKLESYTDLAAAAEFVEVITTDQERLTNIFNLSTLYTDYAQQENKLLLQLVRLEGVDEAQGLLTAAETAYESKSQLLDLELRYNKYQNDINIAQDKLAGLQQLKEGQGILEAVTAQQKQIDALQALYDDHAVKATNTQRYVTWLEQAKNDEAAAKLALTEAWEAAGGICPLCEQTHKGGGC
ncbi:exonuclease [Bacillus phage vB_BboS-125]|uniref:Chromosome segregation protein n=1 Tax=Bacillus phage vB_BboS-125 TaxID=2419618 RepID=A0A3G3BVU5_9CAUD|nr:exonuclease [Bacillus phage vB_BboS-125]AYP68402.1 chromosome segregation protein [Bacillus phage vB_BboS-125]